MFTGLVSTIVSLVSKINWKKVLPWTITGITVLLFLLLKSCESSGDKISLEEFNHLATKFKTRIAKDSAIIVIQEQIIVRKNSDIAKHLTKIEGLKNIKQQVKIVTETKIEKIRVAYTEPPNLINLGGPLSDSTNIKWSKLVTTRCVELPYSFGTNTKWYGFGITLNEESFTIDSLVSRDNITFTYGVEKEKGLRNIFKKPRNVVSYKNENPHVKVESFSNVTIESPESRLGVDIQVGYGFSSLNMASPYVGIGLGYRILSFKKK